MREDDGAARARVLREVGLPPWYQPSGWGRGPGLGWVAAVPLPACAALQEALGAPVYEAFAAYGVGTLEPGEVPLLIETEGRWPEEVQFMNWHWLRAMDDELAAALLTGLLAHLPDAARALEGVPQARDPVALRPHVALTELVLHAVPHATTPYLGAIFRCAWDEEHGLGLVLCGTEVLAIGAADVATDGERSREHRARIVAAPPPGA